MVPESKRPLPAAVKRTVNHAMRPPTSARRQLLVTIGMIFAVAGMGLLDFSTGPSMGFSLFYLIPVAITAWQFGRSPGVIIAFAASLAWLIADIPLRYENELLAGIWNGLTRAIIFMGAAVLLSRVRADQEKLADLVRAQARLARTDPLTLLPNSRAFMEHIRMEVARSRRHKIPVCLAYMDVDNFKRVNDAFGHGEGDALLRSIADLLRGNTRAEDLAARLGGDEFALLLSGVGPEQAELVGRRIVDSVVAMRKQYPGTNLGASVGMYHCQVAPEDPSDLIRFADRAMYAAKSAGKNRIQLSTEATNSEVHDIDPRDYARAPLASGTEERTDAKMK